MEISGLTEEIAKGEFVAWSPEDLSRFIKQAPPETLRWLAAVSQLKKTTDTENPLPE